MGRVGRRFRVQAKIVGFLALIENAILASSKPDCDRKEKASLEKSAVAGFLAKTQLV